MAIVSHRLLTLRPWLKPELLGCDVFFVGQSLRTFAIDFETAVVYIRVSHVRHLDLTR